VQWSPGHVAEAGLAMHVDSVDDATVVEIAKVLGVSTGSEGLAKVIHRANIAIHDNDVYIAGANITAPTTLEEARASEEWPLWDAECINELVIMEEMRVFSKVERSSMPLGMALVECRWVFAFKFNPDGSISRRKARLVAKGYMELPPGSGDNTNSVLLLHRAIYGLKQAAREWHSALRSQLDSMGYRAMHADPGTFV
jgi:hypothetical protein